MEEENKECEKETKQGKQGGRKKGAGETRKWRQRGKYGRNHERKVTKNDERKQKIKV